VGVVLGDLAAYVINALASRLMNLLFSD